MKLASIKVLLVLVAFVGAVFTLTGTAEASHAKMDIAAPSKLTVGDSLNIEAVLRITDGGKAIAGATVTFSMAGSFWGVDGDVVLGHAVTDEHGIANFAYQPRFAGEHQLRVQYLTPGASAPEEMTWTHTVADSAQQLHHSTAGVQIPGLNVWLLIAVVGMVWAILLSVALLVVAIAYAGADGGAVSRTS